MTSKSSPKDYKALYKALKTKHDFVLEMSSTALNEALTSLKAKDKELAKYKKLLEPKFNVRGYIDSRKEAEATAKVNVMNYIDDRIARITDSD